MLDFSVIPQTLPLLLEGLGMTLALSAMALLLGFAVGVLMCSARLASSPLLRFPAACYVSVFRGIPLLVQLMISYYCLPLIGIKIPALAAATICTGLCSGAYMTEILRGGFMSLPPGQTESAAMLGFSRLHILMFIQLPQVVRLTIPGLVNEVILLIKASSLISAVGIAELTRTAQNLAASNFQPFEFYLTAALLYFVLNTLISAAGLWLERYFRKGAAAV